MVIVTWNANIQNRWERVRQMLLGSPDWPAADFICLQECGEPPPWDLVHDFRMKRGDPEFELNAWNLDPRRHDVVGVLHCRWGYGNSRCSMAIISREPFRSAPGTYVITSEKATRRPLLGLWLPGQFLLGCAHFVASQQAAESARGMLDMVGKNITRFAIFGDFNCAPQTLHAQSKRWKPQWPDAVTTTAESPSCIDYACSTTPMSACVRRDIQSDIHMPVYFQLNV